MQSSRQLIPKVTKSLVISAVTALSLLTYQGCNPNGPVESCKCECESCKCDTSAPPTKVFIDPVQPTTGILFFDASGSMGGYLQAENEPRFIGAVSEMYKLVPQLKACLHGIVPEDDTLSCSDFIDKLNKRQIKWKPESEMNSMMSTLMSSTDDIAILVTDGIMSGTSAQTDPTKGGKRSYSIDNRDLMKNVIYNIVRAEADSNAILIVRAVSKFTGQYYPYYNTPPTYISNQERPFFIICTGKKRYVKWINQQLAREADAASWQMLLLGDDYSDCFTPKYGKGLKTQGSKVAYENRNNKTFELEFNISELPDYMQTAEYMSQNLTFSYNLLGQRPTIIEPKLDIDSTRKCLKVEVERITLLEDGGELHYQLSYNLPTWVETLSTDDDSGIPDPLCRTFNLKYFIMGLTAINQKDNSTGEGSNIADGTIEFTR